MEGFEKLAVPQIDRDQMKAIRDALGNVPNRNVMANTRLDYSDLFKTVEKSNQKREQVQIAQIETAKNTAEMSDSLKEVIKNQNEYIDILKKQLSNINETLDLIFDSVYDGKEILEESNKIFESIYYELKNGKKVDIKTLLADKSMDVITQVMFLITNMVNQVRLK